MTDNFSQLVTNYFKNDYRERGKIKWQGYFLSDHTASLKQEKTARQHISQKLERMALSAIKSRLQYANLHYELVIIQEDYATSDKKMFPDIVGLVAGFSDRGVVVDKQHILFENIRAVRLSRDNN
ncbi:hypothetical protein [Leuconostoc citreum]|uniref:Uncharacterized protein n=1 Tax=Leuconostoc citreum TaxID=33964 RepID=A0A5A5U1A6_LEUCI|nr:hypothetical protein [Leuconostoc citreum]MBU7450218.1 hypothetical protein [Leuconostoc citreum]MCK8606225.1 hypothetical protein [Leuconostoc citreum]MCS8584430.1 hypothetical protein [Leuconostoc citreum]MCS8595198.1 hypothetical protein [Leuconostoc citreum]MCS8601922.1 hypothetical protein [Leuconostoc citreum]